MKITVFRIGIKSIKERAEPKRIGDSFHKGLESRRNVGRQNVISQEIQTQDVHSQDAHSQDAQSQDARA